jgi:hypothetical protein
MHWFELNIEYREISQGDGRGAYLLIHKLKADLAVHLWIDIVQPHAQQSVDKASVAVSRK